MEAGVHFGLEAYIRAQIGSVVGGEPALIDRFVEGSRTHAERRLHEMEAVAEMLEQAGLSAFILNGKCTKPNGAQYKYSVN
jgi:hypothetical protein